MSQETQNVMKIIRLEKVVLNMGLGKSGDAVEIAKKALEQISGSYWLKVDGLTELYNFGFIALLD